MRHRPSEMSGKQRLSARPATQSKKNGRAQERGMRHRPSGNREIRDSPKDRILSRITAAFRNEECASAHPEYLESRDSPKDRIRSRRTDALRSSECDTTRLGIGKAATRRKIGYSVEERPRSGTRNAPMPIRKIGKAETRRTIGNSVGERPLSGTRNAPAPVREIGKAATRRKIGYSVAERRAQDRGIRRFPSETS